MRLRSLEHFVQELALLHRKGVNFFYFSDDTFTIKRDRVIEICQKIIERDLQISWYAISRVDCVDEEVLYWMRKAGCIQISFGIESGSEKIRKRLNKKMNEDLIRRFGRKLRKSFYENVHRFVDDIELVEQEELYEKHADFLSRLGMTFSQGDYSNISEIREKERTAKKLFERSLEYAPNHRAYLGLGILNQKQGDYAASIRVLSKGIKIYPDSEHLNKCLAISYMNAGNRERAFAIFSKFPHTRY